MDSANPYEPPTGSLLDDVVKKTNWPRALCVAVVYAVVAVVLFGLLQLYLSPQGDFPSPPRTFANVGRYVFENFFVALWFAGPMAMASALLDFAPPKRLGVIRSFAIAGGVMMSIFILTVLAMSFYDDFHRDTFVRARRTYFEENTWRYWVGLAVGQFLWWAIIAVILWRRLRADERFPSSGPHNPHNPNQGVR
jgi:hypothetical protein